MNSSVCKAWTDGVDGIEVSVTRQVQEVLAQKQEVLL